ncbi:MAG TPA: alpha-glucan family phosphorylase [Gemmatimonadales bacterium]|nr:alpha-glucan family phosphorylase [Gemmatimonadales bacterium]
MTSLGSKIPYLPERISGLNAIAHNLWWSWSRDARALFRAIDQPLWHLTRHNPIDMLRRVDPARLAECAEDPDFLARYDLVLDQLTRESGREGTWFATTYSDLKDRPIAYFCAEFGLHNSVPIYSGGLGVLAGDHCKASSDLGLPLVGIGLLYTRGYFDQRLRLDGWQEAVDETFDATLTPLERVAGPGGEPVLTTVPTYGRPVGVGAWRMMVGRVPIYLLDTDHPQNDPADRELCQRLYGGSEDLRLRQEWILGVGGVRVLRALGVTPAVWHANEGHAAFMLLERLRELVSQGRSWNEAVREVRQTSVFTTHTPVPAGHDAFALAQVEQCIETVWKDLTVHRDAVLQLGRSPSHDHGQFHMPVLAIKLSGSVNGVSRMHGEVSRRMWNDLWPGRDAEQVPIQHVTNGVHVSTWMSHHMHELLTRDLGPEWPQRVEAPGFWQQVYTLDDAALWEAHFNLKVVLLRSIREMARRRWVEQWKAESQHLVGAGTLLDERALTIGFARRFASYKRASLIFHDVERLRRLLTNPWRPVHLVFAGKAHPADEPGKRILQQVYEFTRDPRFEGRVAFIEDYEMHLAHRLVQGVDLWLNLPRAPLEASGTSGMKAALNGVPQLSTLDGWWHEGYEGKNGWAIPPAKEGEDSDAADAEHLYHLLEEQVVPLFYTRDSRGIPTGWVERMKHAVRIAGERFTARRMVQQYTAQYYVPLARGERAGDDPPTV